MVAAINPAEAGSLTLEAYASLARNAGNAVSPAGGPFGGVVAPNPAASQRCRQIRLQINYFNQLNPIQFNSKQVSDQSNQI